jgi:hypothetical protein
VTILGDHNEAGGLFTAVTVRNDGAAKVRSVTFGVLVFDRKDTSGKPTYIAGKALSVNLAPGDSMNVTATVVSRERAEALMKQYPDGAEARLGVAKVDFDNGPSWTFDAVQKGKWDDGFTVSANYALCGGWFKVAMSTTAHAFGLPTQWYTCTLASDQWCENLDQGAKCNDHVCDPKLGECPNQKCLAH